MGSLTEHTVRNPRGSFSWLPHEASRGNEDTERLCNLYKDTEPEGKMANIKNNLK